MEQADVNTIVSLKIERKEGFRTRRCTFSVAAHDVEVKHLKTMMLRYLYHQYAKSFKVIDPHEYVLIYDGHILVESATLYANQFDYPNTLYVCELLKRDEVPDPSTFFEYRIVDSGKKKADLGSTLPRNMNVDFTTTLKPTVPIDTATVVAEKKSQTAKAYTARATTATAAVETSNSTLQSNVTDAVSYTQPSAQKAEEVAPYYAPSATESKPTATPEKPSSPTQVAEAPVAALPKAEKPKEQPYPSATTTATATYANSGSAATTEIPASAPVEESGAGAKKAAAGGKKKAAAVKVNLRIQETVEGGQIGCDITANTTTKFSKISYMYCGARSYTLGEYIFALNGVMLEDEQTLYNLGMTDPNQTYTVWVFHKNAVKIEADAA